jgi:hypothetical protein
LAFVIKKAVRKQAKLRLALVGPPGSGKTWTALATASGLGEKILLVETEGNSSSWYANDFSFDVICLNDNSTDPYHPLRFVEAIKQGEEAGYDVIIIDSLSHAWMGEGGSLDLANKEQTRSKSGNSYVAWRSVTPLHNKLVNAILQSKKHIIATMRTKEKRVIEQDERGKTRIRTLGLEPIMRDGVNFEFTVVADMDQEHNFIVTKTRCSFLDEAIIPKPGKELGEKLLDWLNSGEANIPEKKEVEPPKIAKAVKTAKSVAEVEREDSTPSQEPLNSSKVDPDELKSFLVKALTFMKQQAVEGKEAEVEESAIEICGVKFGVKTLTDLPAENFEDLKAFMRTDLFESLRKDGLIKGK